MTYQQQALQSIADSMGGSLGLDEILFVVVVGLLFVGYVGYGLWYQIKVSNGSHFESMH